MITLALATCRSFGAYRSVGWPQVIDDDESPHSTYTECSRPVSH